MISYSARLALVCSRFGSSSSTFFSGCPAVLRPGLGPHLPYGSPETEGAVADGEDQCPQAAVLQGRAARSPGGRHQQCAAVLSAFRAVPLRVLGELSLQGFHQYPERAVRAELAQAGGKLPLWGGFDYLGRGRRVLLPASDRAFRLSTQEATPPDLLRRIDNFWQ